MPDQSLRVLTARLDDMEERYDAALKELRELRAEGAAPEKIEAAVAEVKKEEEKVKTAEEEIADAKATLKRHGYELEDDDDTPPPADPPTDPPADPVDPPADPPPPAPPKPSEVPPEPELHWSERKLG